MFKVRLLLMALHVVSLRCRIWSLSVYSGLWQAVRPADLWVHGLVRDRADDEEVGMINDRMARQLSMTVPPAAFPVEP